MKIKNDWYSIFINWSRVKKYESNYPVFWLKYKGLTFMYDLKYKKIIYIRDDETNPQKQTWKDLEHFYYWRKSFLESYKYYKHLCKTSQTKRTLYWNWDYFLEKIQYGCGDPYYVYHRLKPRFNNWIWDVDTIKRKLRIMLRENLFIESFYTDDPICNITDQ